MYFFSLLKKEIALIKYFDAKVAFFFLVGGGAEQMLCNQKKNVIIY